MTDIDLAPELRRTRRDSKARHRGVSSLSAVPFDPSLRWALRGALAIPFILLSVALSASPERGQSGNLELLERVRVFEAGSGITGFDSLYPPVSTVLGLLLQPFGILGLSIAGSLVAGFLIQKLAEVLIQRGVPVAVSAAMLAVLTCNPLFAYLATGNLPVILALTAFGLGVTHMMRFIVWGATAYGFRAGLCFLAALMCHQAALFFVIAAALSAPFIAWKRTGQTGARRASIFVLVFPSLFGIVTLFLLQLVFLGDPARVFGIALFANSGENLQNLLDILATPSGAIVWGPGLATAAMALILRSPGIALMGLAQFLAVSFGYVAGLITATSSGLTYVVTVMLVFVMQPLATSKLERFLLPAGSLFLIMLAWTVPFSRPLLSAYMAQVQTGLQAIFG